MQPLLDEAFPKPKVSFATEAPYTSSCEFSFQL